MFTTLVLALTLGVVVADVSLGYKYRAPVNIFGSVSPYQINNYNSAYRYPAVSFGKGTSGYTGSLGQGLSGSAGSLGQGSITSTFSQGSYVPASSGQSSSAAIGYNYNGLPSKFSVGSGTGSNYKLSSPGLGSVYDPSGSTASGSNYNTFTTSGGVAPGVSGSDTSYNTFGSSSNYNVPGTPNLGSNSNYNTFVSGSESNYNIPNQQGVYQGSTIGQNYQGTYQTAVDTSNLDKIGSHYQAASAANQFISTNPYQTSIVPNYQDYYSQIQRQPVQVFKHYYVHAAPEDIEPLKPRPSIVLPPPQKHYKIIFIKAPTQQPQVPQVIPVPEQNEEKTIVYILLKKPEDVKNIVLPKFEQKTPAKPDVYFIKYNDKQNSQTLIDSIVNDYNKGGISASFSGIPGGLGGSSGSRINSGTEDTIFDYRFGSNSESSVNTVTGSVAAKPSSSVSSGSSYTVANNVSAKPTVSFGTAVTGSSLDIKPTSFESRFGSSSNYSPASGSSFGANSGIYGSKATSTLSSGSSLTASNVGNIPVRSSGSGFSFGTRVTGANNPNINFGSSSSSISGPGSSLVSGTIGTGTKVTSIPSAGVNSGYYISSLGSGSTLAPSEAGLNSIRVGSYSFPSTTVSSTLDVSSSPNSFGGVNTLSVNPSSGSLSSASTGSGLSSGSSFSSETGSYNSGLSSYGSESTLSSSSGSFGTGPSKFDSSSGLDSSISESDSETSILSTSQGIPHETYGPPKFKAL